MVSSSSISFQLRHQLQFYKSLVVSNKSPQAVLNCIEILSSIFPSLILSGLSNPPSFRHHAHSNPKLLTYHRRLYRIIIIIFVSPFASHSYHHYLMFIVVSSSLSCIRLHCYIVFISSSSLLSSSLLSSSPSYRHRLVIATGISSPMSERRQKRDEHSLGVKRG